MPASIDSTIDVRSLVDQPGATRALDRQVVVPPGLGDDLVALGPHVTVDAIIESVVDGLLLRGTVTAPARMSCARCLTIRDETVRADVVELFTSEPDDDEPGYGIVDATINLDALLRDGLAAVMPVRPLCRPDCPGLCPTCGADLTSSPCDGHLERLDPRWAVLSELQLPDTDQN